MVPQEIKANNIQEGNEFWCQMENKVRNMTIVPTALRITKSLILARLISIAEAAQWAYDRIHYIPPSHHMVKSSGEFIVSSVLDVAILAERGKNCDKQCHFSRSLFILALSLCLLDQREFAAYSTALDAGRDWGQEEKGTRG